MNDTPSKKNNVVTLRPKQKKTPHQKLREVILESKPEQRVEYLKQCIANALKQLEDLAGEEATEQFLANLYEGGWK